MVALLTIDVAGGETFTCGLVPGSDEASLARAVGARAGVDSDGFFLTMGTNRDGVVVPLTTALGSTRLTLHLRPPKSTPPPTPPPSPPPLPASLSRSSTLSNLGGSLKNVCEHMQSTLAPGQIKELVSSLYKQDSDEALSQLEKYSRMGTTLSNERTMLAWVRTVLAIVRSTFAFYGLTGTAGLGEESLSAVRYMMATVAILTFGTGAIRYASIADLLREKAIRRPVCRVPMTPFLLMVFTCTVMHSAATYRGMWCKGKDCLH